MPNTVARDQIRQEVLEYLRVQAHPVRMSSMAADLRVKDVHLSGLRDSDLRDVVQPMIVTGKLSYAPGLKIKLGSLAELKARPAGRPKGIRARGLKTKIGKTT